MNEQLLQKIVDCPTLPTLPTVALEILQLSREPEVNMGELAAAVSKDAALASKILRTVNSSFYGHSQNISTLRHAVTFLGIDAVKTLVLGFSIIHQLGRTKPRGFSHVNYWRRSIYGATAARVLAEKLLYGNQETCFLAALLMDVGMLVFDRVIPEQYGEVCDRARNHEELRTVEQRVLKMNHADVVRVLAEQWKLASTLATPMVCHHRPQAAEEPVERKLTEVVHIAGRMADIFVDQRPAMSIADVRRLCMELYNLGELDCDAILVSIGQKTRQLAPLFEIPVDNSLTYEQILNGANDELLTLTLSVMADGTPEKRRAPRVRRENALVILPCSAGVVEQPVTVKLKDVSSGGLGFYHTEAMERGKQFIVQLPQKQGKPVSLLYTVVRSQRVDVDKVVVGAQLQRILNPEQVVARKEKPAGATGKIASAVLTPGA